MSALPILVLSANQIAYAPKQGIHTLLHVAPAEALISLVTLTLLLPLVERTRPGRWVSFLVLLALCGAVVVLSSYGHDFASVLHKGLHSSHLKHAAPAAALALLAVWQAYRLGIASRRPMPASAPLPTLPAPVWALLIVAVLSAVTMVLPSESPHDWLHTPEGKEPIRKAALFLIEMFQQLGAALFLFLVVLQSPGRTRLAVRSVLLGTLICVLAALPQYIHWVLHPVAASNLAAAGLTTDHYGPLVEGLMQSRKAHGGFLCMALPLTLGCLLGSRRRVVKVAYSAILALGLLTDVSGAAVWCSLLGLAVTGYCAPQAEGRKLTAATVALGLFFALLIPANRHQVVNEFFRLRTVLPAAAASGGTAPAKPTATIQKEYIEWVAGIYMTSEHFWLGVGPGQYQLNIGQYYGQDPNPEVRLERDSNNLYFVYASSLGLAGLAALLQIVLTSLSRAWRTSRSMEPRSTVSDDEGALRSWPEWWQTPEGHALAAGVCGALIAFLAVNFFTALLVRGIGILFAFLVALAASMQARETAS